MGRRRIGLALIKENTQETCSNQEDKKQVPDLSQGNGKTGITALVGWENNASESSVLPDVKPFHTPAD
jgi:hypothetical protein